ncbi:amylo-alpha-1,6-glucosidase [[Eubacterium] cellulosolvens]
MSSQNQSVTDLFSSLHLSILELEQLGISVLPDDPHEYVLTNRDSIHWIAETNKEETRKWQGLVKNRWNTLTNIWADVDSYHTTNLDIVNTVVYPHLVITNFRIPKGSFSERIALIRNRNVMIIQYITDFSGLLAIRPQFGMRKDWSAQGSNYVVTYNSDDGILFVSTNNIDYEGPKLLGIKMSKHFTFVESQKILPRQYFKDEFRGDGNLNKAVFEAGRLITNTNAGFPVTVVIVLGDSETEVVSLIEDCFNYFDNWWEETTNSLIRILENTGIKTGNILWDKALKWTLMSLDSLTMNVTGRGIYAGLPWFPEYWGRDSFISFPGAVLTAGQFDMAKDWIRTMISHQDKNPSSPTYGRVPNILQVNVRHPNYETADGTGWFIKALWSYFEYAGLDYDFLKEVWPTVKIAIKGEYTRLDEKCFLTHGDRETWMDAIYNGIIATPRGNRAVEIQALWFTELDIGRRLAKYMNETGLAEQWEQDMLQLKRNFQKFFWNSSDEDLFDHLHADGKPDYQKRPNQIFVITVPLSDNPLLPPSESKKVLESVIKHNVAPHGIRSLSSNDPNYRPLHDYGSRLGHEHHDFSYHNGDVWLWLSGSVIESCLRFHYYETAKLLTEVLLQRVLIKDALGTLAEIMDGTDPNGDPLGHSRGTISQAWSLAELLRSYYQSWLGIRPNGIARTLTLIPFFEIPLANVFITFRQNEGIIHLHYNYQDPYKPILDIKPEKFDNPLNLEIIIKKKKTEEVPALVIDETVYEFESCDGEKFYRFFIRDFLDSKKKIRVILNNPVFSGKKSSNRSQKLK